MKKRMFKRISTIVLAALMAVSLMPVMGTVSNGEIGQIEAKAEESGLFVYEKNLNAEGVTITEYTGSDSVVEVPATIDGNEVTGIKHAFSNNSTLEEVIISNGISIIDVSAFEGCENLLKVSIPDSVTEIADNAFDKCINLTTVYYGGSENEWKNITIGTNNDYLTDADFQYSEIPADQSFSFEDATVTGITEKTYTGEEITLNLTVALNDIILVEDTDYTVSYKNNVNVGTATVLIEGKGDYTGETRTETFLISKASIKAAIVTGIGDKTYTGKAITQSPVVKLENKTLKSGTDYKVSYKNNTNPGTATVTITGEGNYKDSVNKTFVTVQQPLGKDKHRVS